MFQLAQQAASDVVTPRKGQLVRVHGCNQRRCSAHVVTAGARAIELRLNAADAHADVIRELVTAPTVALEFLGEEWMNRLYAKAHLVPGSDGTSLFLLPRGGTQMLGRRKHLRTELDAVAVLQNHETGEHVDGWVVNMSAGGMLVDKLAGPVEFGRRYGFSVVPSGDAPSITGTAEVVRVESLRRAALRIAMLATPSSDELARFLFEHAEIRRAAR